MRQSLGAGSAFILLLVALLDYQPNALLCVVLVAAGWTARPGANLRWAAWHIGLVLIALATAFVASKTMFAWSGVERSPRFAVETDWGNKLAWSTDHALQNALALEVLADDAGKTEPWHRLAAAASSLAIIAFGGLTWRRLGWAAAWSWWAGFLPLALLAYAVSFVAAEHWATYRTILPLSGVVVVFLVHALASELGPRRRTTLLFCSLLGFAAILARHDSHEYLAGEQETELALVEAAARKINPDTVTRISLLLPTSENPSASIHYLDEYGSLSTDADWCAKEMLLLLLYENYPGNSGTIAHLQVTAVSAPPRPGTYDALLDLRPEGGAIEPRHQVSRHHAGAMHN